MIRFTDTHSHLYLPEFTNDIDLVIKRSIESNVDRIILPCIDAESIEPILNLVSRYPQNCIPLLGLHPTQVKENYKEELEKVFNLYNQTNFAGIGEIGIDLYWDKTFLDEQILVFEQQLSFALQKDLPVVIHARDSFDEIFGCLEKPAFTEVRGVFHAFTGNQLQAEKIISMGFKLGIGGIVTFKNSNLASVVKSIGLEHIVLETDSPYLAPMPFRGKRNESSYIRIIADKISEIAGTKIENVAEITTRNAKTLFKL